MKSEVKQRKELVMNRSTRLLVCLAMGVALCGCQTTQNGARLGECRLHVEAWWPAPQTYNGLATVSINGMVVGTVYGNTVGHFEIKLAPGTYDVAVTAEGYETSRDKITILGKDQDANLRLNMKPGKPATEK